MAVVLIAGGLPRVRALLHQRADATLAAQPIVR